MRAIVPMKLGDIFDKTFRIIGGSFPRSALIILLLLLPVSLLLIASMDEFYSTIGEVASALTRHQALTPADFPASVFGLFGFSVLVAIVAGLTADLGVTTLAGAEMIGLAITTEQVLRRVVGVRLWRAIGAALLQFFAVIGVMILPFVLLTLSAGSIGGAIVSAVVLLIAVVSIIVLIIRWSFALTVIALENAGPYGALRRSWKLLNDQWWRVLGILLLLGFLTGFAISIVSAPLTLVGFWDFYKQYFSAIGAAGKGQPDPEAIAGAISSMGIGVGISMSISMMLTMLVRPVYTTVLYFDLRARHSEFATPDETVIVGDHPPSPPELV